MRTITAGPNLELDQTWLPQFGPDVNPVQPTTFDVRYCSDAMEIYMSGPANCAALVAYKIPIYPEFKYGGLDLEVWYSETAAKTLRCQEMDVKGCISGHIYDWSSQINYSKGGMLQQDDVSQGWVDTGYVLGPAPVNQWVRYSFKYSMDPVKHTFSQVSLSVNGHPPVASPPKFPNVPCFKDAWDDVWAIQIQPCLNVVGGISMRYRNIRTWQGDQ
jgi:hypothetical protein